MDYGKTEDAALLEQLRSRYTSFHVTVICSVKLHPTSSTSVWASLLIFAFPTDFTKPVRISCVSDLGIFVSSARPYMIGTTFRNRTLDDLDVTIEAAGLANSVVVQRWA